jgi:poly-gamma-glutamate synthesis protein (capsule biosynthesis protein)
MNESGGTYMRADPALARELSWAGFDLVSRANNHSGDYGVGAMRLTTRYVAEAGLVQAGVGESLREAREARFLETAHGRVALVSVCSTFPDHIRAGNTGGDMPARPGLNPLRFSTTYRLSREDLETFRGLLRRVGQTVPEKGDQLRAFNQRFVVHEQPGMVTEPLKVDLDENAAVVRSASRLADYVIVSLHSHEGDRNRFAPAQFAVTFARAMVEAGADVVVGHGAHVLRGIEIYKGKPILYSLGDFMFQNETLQRFATDNYESSGLGVDAQAGDYLDRRYGEHDERGFPADPEIWRSVIAAPRWAGERLVELTLHPITLGFGKPRAERGRPMLAEGEEARKILEDLAVRSKAFGTTIQLRGGMGVVLPAKAGTGP